MSESQHIGFRSPTGCIVDIALNIRWDGTQLAREVARRAAVLSDLNVHRGPIVGILHNGSAHFFADLFAVWRMCWSTCAPREACCALLSAKDLPETSYANSSSSGEYPLGR